MRRIKEYYITIIVIVMVIAVNLGAFASYITNIRFNLSEQTDSHVDDVMDEAVECINIKLEEQINTLDTLALFVTTLNSHNDSSEILEEALSEQKKKSGYSVLEVVSRDGIGEITGNNYSETKYFANALEGNTVMQEESNDDTVESVAIAAPIYEKDSDNVVAVLVAKMGVSTFSDTIELSSFSQNGKVFVVKKDGTLVSKSKDLSDANSINDILPQKQYESQLVSGMRSRNSGIIKYENDSATRYIGYSKLSYNKWYVVCIISSSAVEARAGDVETDVIVLGIEMGIMLFVLVVYLIYNIISVKNKGKMNLERYFITTKHSDSIMIDYSMAKNTMYCNDKWEEIFGYSLPKANVKEAVIEHIFKEDLGIYEENISKLTETQENVEFKLRALDKDGNTKMCTVKLFPICEKKGKLTKIVGLIESEE